MQPNAPVIKNRSEVMCGVSIANVVAPARIAMAGLILPCSIPDYAVRRSDRDPAPARAAGGRSGSRALRFHGEIDGVTAVPMWSSLA
ncbi:MAG TPA: hypothetical protein VFI22_03260, partial [Thermomicrobiales bacterium]|nr:hypothetical protein [Thermomicrobiales bacterium]